VGLGFGCVAGAFVSIAIWLIPVDLVQGWAFERAPKDPLAQFEAGGTAEALWWILRAAAAVWTILFSLAWYRQARTVSFARGLFKEFAEVMNLSNPAGKLRTRWQRIFGGLRCAGVLAMFALALVHQADAVFRRARDWPVYQLYSGESVLPNMSDSNRAVIHYLKTATPEGSRIFVVSDQKLFFLSYYLLPRRLLHHIHPEAEHVIPRAYQGRQLAAYRLSEISSATLKEQRPDFVLEYFEGPEYVQAERALEDTAWLTFVRRQKRDQQYVPPYTVVLRPWTESSR
jgi:hypothetical protein